MAELADSSVCVPEVVCGGDRRGAFWLGGVTTAGARAVGTRGGTEFNAELATDDTVLDIRTLEAGVTVVDAVTAALTDDRANLDCAAPAGADAGKFVSRGPPAVRLADAACDG